MEARYSGFTDNDLVFLLETVDYRLVSRLDVIKNDPAIIEGMLDQEIRRIFDRLMIMEPERIFVRISPRFLFEILLRQASEQLKTQRYTVERTMSRQIPVFDSGEVASFLQNKTIIKYLSEMLTSFTRTESFTWTVRIREGVWRKIRFSDMDIDSLSRLCEAAGQEQRFGFYKRIADLCLFILGIFPEYAPELRYGLQGDQIVLLSRASRHSAEDYEHEGRRFYKLACEHKTARTKELSGVLCQLHENFNLAKKPLNLISEYYMHFHQRKVLPALS